MKQSGFTMQLQTNGGGNEREGGEEAEGEDQAAAEPRRVYTKMAAQVGPQAVETCPGGFWEKHRLF